MKNKNIDISAAAATLIMMEDHCEIMHNISDHG
jgi:hypothetical protein